MGDLNIDDLGIDLEGVKDPRSFLEGLLWFVRAMREVNENVKQDTYKFDGDPHADGVRFMLEKQEEVFNLIEQLALAVLNREA